MERRPRKSSLVLALTLAMLSAPGPAQSLTEAQKSLYQQRLADSAAGVASALPGSPLLGVGSVPILDAVVTWDRLRRDTYLGPFGEYAAFLKASPDFPQTIVIRRQAEKSITDATPMAERLAHFRAFPPLTAWGKFRLAEAQLATGDRNAARTTARDAWDSSGLDAAQEAQFTTLFGTDMRVEDHLARADRLLWSGQISAAGRLVPFLPMDRRLWVLARIALRGNSPDALARLAGVPDGLRDEPGLIHDRALWLRRKGDTAGAIALFANADIKPGSVSDPETWLKTRLDLARVAWRAGDTDGAYRALARHNSFGNDIPVAQRSLAQRQLIIDAEWLAGWLSLRRLGRPAAALAHFRTVRAAALTPLSQTRGDYWIGRAAEAAGDRTAARVAYEAAASHFDYFYGQLATERLGRPVVLRRVVTPQPDANTAGTFRADARVRAVFALGELGDRARQTIFLKHLADTADTLPRQQLVAGLAGPLARPDAGVYAGKAARSDGELALLDAAFPVLPLPPDLVRDFTPIHAIARQESQFDRAARSPANALGLMQLLPSTAAETAGKLGLDASTAMLTEDPIYNARLGSAYFRRLLAGFGGSWPLAVAAYNAGPGNARKFIAANGDPRAGIDVVDWVESIPLSETRNYVQRVLENAVVYDLLRPDMVTMTGPNRLSNYLGKPTPG